MRNKENEDGSSRGGRGCLVGVFFSVTQVRGKTAKRVDLLCLRPMEIKFTTTFAFCLQLLSLCQNLPELRKFWLVLLLSFNEPAQISWAVKKDTQLSTWSLSHQCNKSFFLFSCHHSNHLTCLKCFSRL